LSIFSPMSLAVLYLYISGVMYCWMVLCLTPFI
jgi:hypothetical protein